MDMSNEEENSYDADYESDFEELEAANPPPKQEANPPKLSIKSDFSTKNYKEDAKVTDKSPTIPLNINKVSPNANKYDYEQDSQEEARDEEYEDSYEEYNSDNSSPKIAANKAPEHEEFFNAKPPPEPIRKQTIRTPDSEIQERNVKIPEKVQAPRNIPILNPPKKETPKLEKNVTTSQLRPKAEPIQKKNRQTLEKENIKLRGELKALNEELSAFLDVATLQMKKKSQKEKIEATVSSGQVTDKKLKIYESEYLTIKERYNCINDPEYLSGLKDKLKQKEKIVSELEIKIKKMTKTQHSRGKKIGDFDDKELGDQKNHYDLFQNEYFQVDELIKKAEEKIEKETSNYEKMQEKSVELEEKYEKLKTLAENYNIDQPVVENKYLARHSILKNSLSNIEKIHTAMLSQLKVQENSMKNQRGQIQKELTLSQEQLKRKTGELKKIRYELEEVLSVASSSNMSKLVSLINLNKRPNSEKSSSPRSESERRYPQALDISRRSNKDTGHLSRNLSSNALKNKIITDKNGEEIEDEVGDPGKNKTVGKNSLQGMLKERDAEETILRRAKVQEKRRDEGIDEEIQIKNDMYKEVKNLKSNQKPSIFEELEEKPKQNLRPMPNAALKPSIFSELEPDIKNLSTEQKMKSSEFLDTKEEKKSPLLKESQPPAKPSIFKELEPRNKPSVFKELEPEDNKLSAFKDPDPVKRPSNYREIDKEVKNSILQELESEPKSSYFKDPQKGSKSSIFKELESDSKPSAFKELEPSKPLLFKEQGVENNPAVFKEPPKTKSSIFKELEEDSKPSIFRELDSGNGKVQGYNNLEFQKVNSKDNLSKYPEAEKPTRIDSGLLGNAKDSDIPDSQLFNQIKLSDPSTSRNRSHLLKKPVTKEDKLLALAENASKQDLFSGFYEKPDDQKVTTNIQSKLLPIRNTSETIVEPKRIETSKLDSLFSEPNKVEPKPKKPISHDLEEEDLIL